MCVLRYFLLTHNRGNLHRISNDDPSSDHKSFLQSNKKNIFENNTTDTAILNLFHSCQNLREASKRSICAF